MEISRIKEDLTYLNKDVVEIIVAVESTARDVDQALVSDSLSEQEGDSKDLRIKWLRQALEYALSDLERVKKKVNRLENNLDTMEDNIEYEMVTQEIKQ